MLKCHKLLAEMAVCGNVDIDAPPCLSEMQVEQELRL